MLLRETWVIAFTEKNGPDVNFGTTLMPKGKVRGAFNYFESLLVNKDSKLKDATWDFVRIMYSSEIMNLILEDSGYIPLRKDYDYSAILANKPHHKAVMDAPSDYILYIEAPNVAYEEMTTRTGEVIQEAYRDASLVNNRAGVEKVIEKARDTAATILKDAGNYSQ
jgi:ABC-type glycerol-3-phosphate transport system substrate-binding protein